MGKEADATTALTEFLDVSPTDAEAWAELSDLYASQGLYQQAIFALEEVLLITPNAWNVCIIQSLESMLESIIGGTNLFALSDPGQTW